MTGSCRTAPRHPIRWQGKFMLDYRVSLHGGHSGDFCDHAEGSLRDTIEAAVAFGYHTFGVSEHAPRDEARFLYEEEKSQGWDVARLWSDFEAYANEVANLADEFADRITILRGFEAEVVPSDRYAQLMQDIRERHRFEFMVGSVHYVGEMLIDGPQEAFDRAAAAHGGIQDLCIAYYETVSEMVTTLRPEVVGHLDLVRKRAPSEESVATPQIREAAFRTLEVIRQHDAILDLNTAGYRKNLGRPYPAPWLVRRAHEMGIGFCFGVDSHGPHQVEDGLEPARRYLLELGVDSITALTREEDSIRRRQISLLAEPA